MTIGALWRSAGVVAASWLAVGGCLAGTVRLDDSGSYALQPAAQMQWRSALPSRQTGPDTEAQVRVQIRIDTRAHIGQTGRIYMVLPLDPGPQLLVEWQTQGQLLPGKILSGQRTLVYAGLLTGPSLDDQFVVRFRSQSDWLANSRQLNFHFELDTP